MSYEKAVVCTRAVMAMARNPMRLRSSLFQPTPIAERLPDVTQMYSGSQPKKA